MKHESSPAYEAYKKFEKFSRPHEISLSDYVTKFEQLHQIAESHEMEVLDGVLTHRLLNNANLPGEKIQLIPETANKIKDEIMKEQLKKVFTRLSLEKRSREEAAKLEQCDSFYTENFVKRECNENALYGKSAVKILHETVRTVTKKEIGSLYKIP